MISQNPWAGPRIHALWENLMQDQVGVRLFGYPGQGLTQFQAQCGLCEC